MTSRVDIEVEVTVTVKYSMFVGCKQVDMVAMQKRLASEGMRRVAKALTEHKAPADSGHETDIVRLTRSKMKITNTLEVEPR